MTAGIVRTGTILDKIIAHKRTEVESAQAKIPLVDLQKACSDLPAPRDFRGALRKKETVALIAEVKHASPSKGILIDPFHPAALAQQYAEHGAAAISVLTDEKYFMGHLNHLKQIRAVVELPLLRKEFIISPYQIYEARAAGADAVLLIVAALEDGLLAELHALALELGMVALVEVHDEAETERALRLNPFLLGVNNRDLHDFSVHLQTTARLAAMIPPEITLVGESGIRTAEDVKAMGRVDAILVGETLVKAIDKIKELSTVPR